MAMLHSVRGEWVDPRKLDLFELAARTISARNDLNRMSHRMGSVGYLTADTIYNFFNRQARARLSGIRLDAFVSAGEPADWYPPFTYI